MREKLVFLGDVNSINIELILRSHAYLKNKTKYILLGNMNDLSKYLNRLNSNLNINEIFDPINYDNYKNNSLNIFNIENISNEKTENIINQINISNHIANLSKIDLVTLPINKSILKKKLKFNGMTEYLGKINKKNTKMLMHGEKFSIIPLTTHINLKEVNKFIKKKFLENSLKEILKQISKNIYKFDFKKIKFLCYNPHCSENGTLGNEDKIITEAISKFKKILGPFAADSAFNDLDKKILFISMYHDQALIPFKLLNKNGINITIGLNYKRLSPAHGTANDIKFKKIAKLSSYLACMEF